MWERVRRSATFRWRRRVGRLRADLRSAQLAALSRWGAGSPDGDPDVVVSMTTHGPRLGRCHLAIESILAGDARPGRLCLWLADGGDLGLTPQLSRLQQRGVEIQVVRPDYRSANKLVHALRAFPGSRIVVADDDALYPRDWLAELLRAGDESPGSVVAHRCRRLRFLADRTLAPIRERPLDGVPDRNGEVPSLDLVGLGVGGVLYPPGSLDERVFDVDLFMALSATDDDVWFKAMGLLAGTPTRRVHDTDSAVNPTIRGTQESALFAINDLGPTDRAFADVFDHFDLYRFLPRPG